MYKHNIKNWENYVLARPFGRNSFFITQVCVTQNMSTVAKKISLSCTMHCFIISFPKLPLHPSMSAAISLSMSRVVLLINKHKNLKQVSKTHATPDSEIWGNQDRAKGERVTESP